MEEQILKAAEKLFLDKGYANTSTADIARQAGCNTALIHYYYRTKTNLFQTIFRHKFKLFANSFIGNALTEPVFETKLRSVISAHFEFLRMNPKLPFLLMNEFSINPGTLTTLKGDLEGEVGSILARIQSEIDVQVAAGKIRAIRAVDLMINIGSLNVVTFLTLPMAIQLGVTDIENYIESRKTEIIRTILNSLKND